MSHFEDLIAEYYDWQGYLVRRNVKVGRRSLGGWEMELDVIAFDPRSKDLVHIEPSLDANSWAERERRFAKKFRAARKYVFTHIFDWLPATTPMRQVAVFASHPKGRDSIAGGSLISVDELVTEIRRAIEEVGVLARNAIPEQYPLLRTIQYVSNGYFGRPRSQSNGK
jgi:hypothetical protein